MTDALEAVRQKVADLERERARAEASEELARRQLDDARKELENEFEVSTVEEAREVLANLEDQVKREASKLADAMKEA